MGNLKLEHLFLSLVSRLVVHVHNTTVIRIIVKKEDVLESGGTRTHICQQGRVVRVADT